MNLLQKMLQCCFEIEQAIRAQKAARLWEMDQREELGYLARESH